MGFESTDNDTIRHKLNSLQFSSFSTESFDVFNQMPQRKIITQTALGITQRNRFERPADETQSRRGLELTVFQPGVKMFQERGNKLTASSKEHRGLP